MRPLGLYVFHFSSFMAFFHHLWRSLTFILYGVSLCRSVLLAATVRSKKGSVAISHSFCFVTLLCHV